MIESKYIYLLYIDLPILKLASWQWGAERMEDANWWSWFCTSLYIEFDKSANNATHSYWITYTNQQNLPIVEPLTILSKRGKTIRRKALFPYEKNEMKGLSIAAVTTRAGPFANAHGVAETTLAGPGLILIN